jgi:hypothetical protein
VEPAPTIIVGLLTTLKRKGLSSAEGARYAVEDLERQMLPYDSGGAVAEGD